MVLLGFIAMCKRNAVEPFAWFRDVLSRIARPEIGAAGLRSITLFEDAVHETIPLLPPPVLTRLYDHLRPIIKLR